METGRLSLRASTGGPPSLVAQYARVSTSAGMPVRVAWCAMSVPELTDPFVCGRDPCVGGRDPLVLGRDRSVGGRDPLVLGRDPGVPFGAARSGSRSRSRPPIP
eukprot:3936426-Rhodomonas_salina.1